MSKNNDRLELRYSPLDTAMQWDRNPKKYDYFAEWHKSKIDEMIKELAS